MAEQMHALVTVLSLKKQGGLQKKLYFDLGFQEV